MYLQRALLVVLAASAVVAQPSAFEAATVKPNHSGSGTAHTDWDNARLRSTNVTLKHLIASAYGLHEDQISGPGWLDSERFDISARAPGPAKDEQLMLMLQNLLAGRFALKIHRETRETNGFALVVAKGGGKLKPASDDGNSRIHNSNGHLTAEHASMAHFAEVLGRSTGFHIADMTGLKGVFDFTLEWDRSAATLSPNADDRPSSDAGISIFTALQEQLGLKLESRKLPIEMLVIDHVERNPAEN